MNKTIPIAFIVGSPRSGTTLLSSLLNAHENIAEFYEPYYLWERYFDVSESDIWNPNNSNQDINEKIVNEFKIFLKKSQKKLVLDKSPYNSFNIELINEIFPNAKWIHILRDGRDVTLSINKEWKKREDIVSNKKFIELYRLIKTMLIRQSYFRYKWMAFKYELKGKSIFSLNTLMNKSRWNGLSGWGPRFTNWNQFFVSHTLLEFNAMQWSSSVNAVRDGFKVIPDDKKIEIRYEDLIDNPKLTLVKTLGFLDMEIDSECFLKFPKINSNNSQKWKEEFSEYEIEKISKIISPLLSKLDY